MSEYSNTNPNRFHKMDITVGMDGIKRCVLTEKATGRRIPLMRIGNESDRVAAIEWFTSRRLSGNNLFLSGST